MKKAQLEQFKTVKDAKPSVARPPPLRRPGTAGAKRPQTAGSSRGGGGGSENVGATPQHGHQVHPASARPGKTSVGSAQSAADQAPRVLTAVEPNVPIATGSGGKARETDEQRRARLCAFQMSIDSEDMCLTGGGGESTPASPTGTVGRVVRSSIAPSPAGGEGGIRSPSIF